ncbi:TlpA family protein disulfide reductase [Azohydromonas lata]|uniref:TlpA disulfide reductase family protein n=1 Tax=Azohydromonas lata TaxID=45677 RepID=A0ABU5IRB8_9BURK|nr:TlpA disulfide reductase family protein [Azohydromonas lata]MDZ5461418.1 TlpA disulfide reductase family protein [Azohydromonas lata]
MLSITLGPLALPVAPLMLLAALALAVFAARRLAGAGQAAQAERALLGAAVAALLAARLGHVLPHWQPYLAQPWAVFDIRDGGWDDAIGVAVAALWLAARSRALPALRRPLLWSALAGVGVWTVLGVAVLAAGGRALPVPAPDVALTALAGGGQQPLAEVLGGRPAVVNLWASWCPPCRAEMPVLEAARRRDGADVRFLLVNQGEAAAVVRAYLKREGMAEEGVWLDATRALGHASGSSGLPLTLFFDAQGRRVHAHLGALNAAALQVQVQRLRQAR